VGQAAFLAELDDTQGGGNDDRGVFRSDGTTVVQIAREGQTAPDENGSFSFSTDFVDPVINNQGQVAFVADLDSTNDRGIFRGDGTSLIQIARAGQEVPNGNGRFGQLFAPALNEAGQVAFVASLIDTGPTENFGIFVYDDQRGLVQVARKSDQLPDGSIANLSFNTDPHLHSSLNNHGQVTYSFQLFTFDSGIAVTPAIPAQPSLPGDFNQDGAVDAADYVAWRKGQGNSDNYAKWRSNFGASAGAGAGGAGGATAVPGPAALWLTMPAGAFLGLQWRGRTLRRAPS
jgi:hypothetical protein